MPMLPGKAFTGPIIDAGMKVHRALGPWLLESAYEHCLVYELGLRGLSVQRQRALPVKYEGLELDVSYRIDVLIEGYVVVEVKAVDKILALHKAQLLTYLKLSACQIGLLMNVNVVLFKDGLRRLVL